MIYELQIEQGLQISHDSNRCIQQVWPLKTKTGQEVAQAFRKLFLAGHPSHLWTDEGTELYKQQLKS